MALYVTPDGEHGFTTREEWRAFFDAYSAVILDLHGSSYDLSRSRAPLGAWVREYRDYSARTRKTFLETELLLNRHVRYFTDHPERWTPEVAAPLLDVLFRRVTRIQDLECVCTIAASLEGYYLPSGNEVALMKCYTVQAVCQVYLDSIHFAPLIWEECCKARVSYEKHFDALTPEEQSMGLTIYDLVFDLFVDALILRSCPPEKIVGSILEFARAARWATQRVAEADRGYDFNRFLPPFDYYVAFSALALSPGDCTPRQAQEILSCARRMESRAPRQEGAVQVAYRSRASQELAYHMALRLTGACTDADVLALIRAVLSDDAYREGEIGDPNDSSPAGAVLALYVSAETLLGGLAEPPELYYKVLELFLDYYSRIPFSTYLNFISSSYIYCYIRRSLNRLSGRQDLTTAILRLTIFRQTQTAVHSLMVGKLAVAITASVADKRPGLLVGQLGARTVDEVRARREEFLDFIHTGALLHDIGKLACPNVVNTQYRRLTQIGYRAIQFHPAAGGELLSGLPALSRFRDLAMGHHKSCDGRRGYPDSFDNTASPLKIFIDILTICDSLDAATDQLGRNYAEPKSFTAVLAELRDARDSRYSGALAELLCEDAGLQDMLEDLLNWGRAETYYQVHQVILDGASVPGRGKSAAFESLLGV